MTPQTEGDSTAGSATRWLSALDPVASVVHDGVSQVRADLRADPYLGYLLLLATILAGMWIWHRVPNFATRDERWRVLDPIRPVGFLVADGELASIREGLTAWRAYGGTFYLYGVVLVPVIAALLLTGQAETVVDLAQYSPRALWADWQSVPAWVWTATVLPARFVNVTLAVGSVYVCYRIGTRVRDRATGRLAALLLSLTWGLVALAHEAGEDVPALCLFLLSFYYSLGYAETGARRPFLLAALSGGLATGFKFTAGVSAFVLAGAHLTRVYRADTTWRALVRPRLLGLGLGLGAAAVLASYPQVLVGAPHRFTGRLTRAVANKATAHSWLIEPSWWWILRGYLHGLGLPLAVAVVGAVAGALAWAHESSRVGTLTRMSAVAILPTISVSLQWSYVRTHHLLTTFPLLVLLVAVGVGRLADNRPTVGRVLVTALVLSAGTYAVAGDLGYAAQSRDRAGTWLEGHADANDTVETYVRDPQESAAPHSRPVTSIVDPATMPAVETRCPDYVLLDYHRSLVFLEPGNYTDRGGALSNATARKYVRALLDGGAYPYEVVATFGRRPRFATGHRPRSRWRALLDAGLRPRTPQYGDPQDFGPNQYVVVLERTGDCESGNVV